MRFHLDNSKADLRTFFKKALRSLSANEQSLKSQLISKILKKELVNYKTEELGVYAPMLHEVQWQLAFPQSSTYLFSRFEGNEEMAFYPSTFSALEKCEAWKKTYLMPKKTTFVVPKVLLIPGLGFTKAGDRLGRGKGYFDRYLENFKGLKIGLCFKVQLTNKLPCDPHDIKMDWIVTEEDIIKL